jgi:hypothetical protein
MPQKLLKTSELEMLIIVKINQIKIIKTLSIRFLSIFVSLII